MLASSCSNIQKQQTKTAKFGHGRVWLLVRLQSYNQSNKKIYYYKRFIFIFYTLLHWTFHFCHLLWLTTKIRNNILSFLFSVNFPRILTTTILLKKRVLRRKIGVRIMASFTQQMRADTKEISIAINGGVLPSLKLPWFEEWNN